MMNPWAILGAVVVVLGLMSGSAYVGGKYEGDKVQVMFDKYKIDSEKDYLNKLSATLADYDKQRLQWAADSKKASQDHEQELSDVRTTAIRDANKRVPIDRGNFCGPSGAGSTKTATPGSAGQATETGSFLPEPFAGNLRQLAADADEMNADFRNLVRRTSESGCFQ